MLEALERMVFIFFLSSRKKKNANDFELGKMILIEIVILKKREILWR